MKRWWMMMATVVLLTAAVMFSGCSYMTDRYDDALDMFDTGILVADTWEPGFACYIDFFQYMPLGYSYVPSAKLLGVANSQLGWLDVRHHAWGWIVDGSEWKSFGQFNPADPRQVDLDDAEGVVDFQRYNAGYLAPSEGEKKAPFLQHFECDRFFYFGWIGFALNIRPLDIGDFVCGWFGLDYMDDDNMERMRWKP